MALQLEHRVIVVGGGVAGLASATYLARGGRVVTLLEKGPALGGRASTDTPKGFALNRGAHALYTGASASEVLRELGVRYTSGSPSRIRALDSAGVHSFPTNALEMLRTDLLDGADKRELAAIFVRLGLIRPASLAHVSVAEWVASIASRPKVRQLLCALGAVYAYSAALDLVSADVVASRLQQTSRHAIHYVNGGWQSLVEGLRQTALASGVEIRTSTGVAEIDRDYAGTLSVRLHGGTELACTDIVLAVTPADAQRLIGSGPDSHLCRSLHGALPVEIACLDLALSKLPAPENPVVFDLEHPMFMTAQSEFASLAPDGGAVVHAFKQLDPRQPAQPHADQADLEAFIDRVQPGWQDVVVERHFLPRMLAAGTLPLVATGGLAGRVSYRSGDVPNVYFAGDWVGPRGYLIDASLDSARESARLILHSRSRVQASLAA